MEYKIAKKIITGMEEKGIEEGLTLADYKKLRNSGLEHEMEKNCIKSDKWNSLYDRYNKLLNQMYHGGLLHRYSIDNMIYIKENSPLLPLVLANNSFPKIRMYGDNSYMFLCQFHNDSNPSMGVTDYKNLFYCFGCGRTGDSIDYLNEYEHFSMLETMDFLSQVYLYSTKGKHTKFSSDLVKKYRDAIISDEHIELLKQGYERLKNRNKFCGINDIDEYYNKRFEMIERIKNNESDPNFKYDEPPKRIKLSK